MNKKILSLVLALVMVLGTFTSVFAENKTTEAKKDEAKVEKIEKVVGKQNKIDYVKDLKIVDGYEDGDLKLDNNIKRSEITKVLVVANGQEAEAKNLQGLAGLYSDLKADHWANGYIAAGTTRNSSVNNIKMLAGYPDGTFKPENDVTYAELAKMLVVLAKKDLTQDMVDKAVWSASWINWAHDLGIFADVNVTDYDAKANRGDAFTMLYNALYTMKEFKRVPSNETRGIISNFTKDVLQLNQDAKAEYKITADSVFVTGENAGRRQIRAIKDIDKKVSDYYLGSLVRVLVNDKNEVTHIIELGNPAELARNNVAGAIKADNEVWRGVADNTVETYNYAYALRKTNVKTNEELYKNYSKKADKYVTVNFKSNNTKVESLTFNNVKDYKNVDRDLTLKITDKTEIYVANPGNNIMKKVANINEALSLVGFQNYRAGYPIFDVYAGFDSSNLKNNYKAIDFDRDTNHDAKIVVFNLVNKTYDGTKYRVIESSSSAFRTTLEKTDGTLVDRNNVYDTSRFPLEYGDKLDVITLDDVRSGSIYETILDHSKTEKFPIVKITAVDGTKSIEIEDKYGERSFLDIRDADIFSAERYGKLEVGTSIQFVTDDKYSNEATVISLLGNEELKGSIVDVLPSVDSHQQLGRIVEVNDINGEHPTIVVRTERNLFNANDKNGYQTYNVSKDNARALVKYEGTNTMLAFKVFTELGWGGNHYAADFRLNEKNAPKIDAVKGLQGVLNSIDALNTKYNPNKVNGENYLDVEKEVKAIEKAIANLTLADNAKYNDPANKPYQDSLKAVKDQIATVKGYRTNQAKAVEIINNHNFADRTTVVPADLARELENDTLNGMLKDYKVNVEFILTNKPADNKNYAVGEEVEFKVIVSSKEDAKLGNLETVEKTLNIAK